MIVMIKTIISRHETTIGQINKENGSCLSEIRMVPISIVNMGRYPSIIRWYHQVVLTLILNDATKTDLYHQPNTCYQLLMSTSFIFSVGE